MPSDSGMAAKLLEFPISVLAFPTNLLISN